jgi:hypothetical protein
MCAVNRISSEPPSHRECAVYAATACPFLSKPQAVRRDGNFPEGVQKGEAAGKMIERNPGVTLLYYTRHHRIWTVPNGQLFQLGRAFRVEWFCRGRPATRAEVLDSIYTGLPTLEQYAEKDGPAALEALDKQLANAMKLIPKA